MNRAFKIALAGSALLHIGLLSVAGVPDAMGDAAAKLAVLTIQLVQLPAPGDGLDLTLPVQFSLSRR